MALTILASVAILARADMKINAQPASEVTPANAGVSDDLPDFSAPAPAVTAALPLVSDKSDIQAAPSNINNDVDLMLGRSANPQASLNPSSAH